MQSAIHEGYEYQDYFTVSIILDLILNSTDAEIKIDRKDFQGDKFDDLKITTDNGIIEYQVKYSDNENAHLLTKDDLSNGNGHDTALSDLFSSWRISKETNKNTDLKLCLAWDRPTDDDEMTDYLYPIIDDSLPFNTVVYKFDVEKFWPESGQPPKQWRKFSLFITKNNINRADFISFCDDLTIFLELPKASLDMDNAGDLESILAKQAEKLGVGIYPNEHLSASDIVYRLATEVKRARAIGNNLNSRKLMGRLGFITDYGKFDQRFPVDSSHQIILNDEIDRLHQQTLNSKRVIISGNPGSGKSWLVDQYIGKLQSYGRKVIHYNCFHSLQDVNGLKRIQVNSLYGNLVSQLLEQFPQMSKKKNTAYGADKNEFENLLRLIEEDFFIVIDGLDHIDREYELHKDQISHSETEIIIELLSVDFPENCFVVISSQPIDDLEKFKEKNFCIHNKEPWDVKQAQALMATYYITDDEIVVKDNAILISEYLIRKSQGNALYLNYILRQLCNGAISHELIDAIPDYDVNLSNYYSYLYTMIHNNHTVNALCGAEFYLSIMDLIEITGDGEYVEQDISILQPLLIENISSGGYSIYHESFRRFILAELKQKKVSLEKNVYGLLVDWLEEKPFFEFDKSFYYLTDLLYRLKRDQDNISLIETEFVRKSVAEGYSRKHIRNNLECIIRSAGRSKDIVSIVTAGELLAMLDDLNEFDSTGEEYFQAICDIKGPSRLNQIMQIDGKPTFGSEVGLLACYISSKAGTRPWWELYLDIDAKKYTIENAKYHYRYYLDKYGVEIIPKLMGVIEKKERRAIREELIGVAYKEIKDYINEEEILLIAENNNFLNWKRFISYIESGYYEVDINIKDVQIIWTHIKTLSMPGKEDADTFERFFSYLYHMIRLGEMNIVEQIIEECKNINWFYNWIIYSIEIAELYVFIDQMDPRTICQKTLAYMELLVVDTDVFKGEPRTCDLYYLRNNLTKSYEQALNLIKKNGDIHDLELALAILERLDNETGTVFYHSMNGPLTDSEFLGIMSRLLSEENYEFMNPFLKKVLERIESGEVYDSIAASKLRYVSMISKYDYNESLEYFNMCMQYLVAYGYRKDIILYEILDSYKVYFDSVKGNTEIERDEITKMTMAVWVHTDGKETNHFFNHWFDILLETEPKYAINLLNCLQVKYGRSWFIEHMLRSVVNKYSGDSRCTNIIIGLIESLPNDTSPIIIESAISVIKVLNIIYEKSSYDEQLFIKHHRDELVVNILSRFNTIDEMVPTDFYRQDDNINIFLELVDSLGYKVSEYLKYFEIKGTDKEGEEKLSIIDKEKNIQHTRYKVNSVEELLNCLEKFDLKEIDLNDISEFLEKFQNNQKLLMNILKEMISKQGGWRYGIKSRNIILQIIKQLELDNVSLAELHMLLFVHSHEWGSALIDNEEFIISCQLEQEVAKEVFWRELPEIIIDNSGKVTKGLINALSYVGDNKAIISIWKNVFNIMRLRFPNLDKIVIDCSKGDTEEYIVLRNCLMMRFVDGGKEQFLSSYAYIANAAEEENYAEFIDAVVYCLDNYKSFNLVTQMAIADLINSYCHRLSGMESNRLIQAIDRVYPTGNLLLDVMLSQNERFKGFLLNSIDKHEPDLLDQEDIEFYLSEKLYELGNRSGKTRIDDFAKNSIYRDPIMMILMVCKIDFVDIYTKLHESRELNSLLADFLGPRSKVPEYNTVYKSYEIQYALHSIIEKAYKDRIPELFYNINGLIPDFRGMYRLFKCRDIQPEDQLFNKENKCESFEADMKEDYILIGSFEIKKKIDYKKYSIFLGYQGLIRKEDDNDSMPFLEGMVQVVGGKSRLVINNDEALVMLNKTHDRELEDNYYLMPRETICEFLKGFLTFDYLHRRYVIIDKENNVMLFFKNWSSCCNGDSEFKGNAIPLYSGCRLFMDKKLYHKLECNYGILAQKTFVDMLTQNY